MSRDYTFNTLTQQMRNRIIAGGFKNHPKPLFSQELMTQVNLGKIPIYSVSGNTSNTIVPCTCQLEPLVGPYLFSYNNLTDGGFPIGNTPNKDMRNDEYTYEFNPFTFQGQFFPGMANFIDQNIVAGDKNSGDRLIASYWDDLDDDVFDDWGYFYLYDPTSKHYYFPLFDPQNQDNGIMTTQTFNVFGRTFTIQHGWTVEGIFKIDITVDDVYPFRFGVYGNMGFDNTGGYENLNEPYSVDAGALSLYYHHNYQVGSSSEQLYIYTIPKLFSENSNQTYDVYYDGDNMSYMTKQIRKGVIMYFSKSYNVKEWVINDLGSMP